MKLFEFEKHYPDEQTCRERFREMRVKQGVTCARCGGTRHTWLPSKGQFRCKECQHYATLRAGTVMHGSKLPFRYWFIAWHLLTATKHTFSAAELQRQLEHPRYQPIWELVHKVRSVMGKRDGEYRLKGGVEVDEGFFTTEIPVEYKDERMKRGAGSQQKAKVLVMVESEKCTPKKRGQKGRKVGYLKMVVIPDLKSATIDGETINAISSTASIVSDATRSHSGFHSLFSKVDAQVVKPEDVGKILPWVHIAIGNAKSLLTDTYHGVKREFLQEYLNEFCYKFNRRYFGEGLFDRLMTLCITYRTDFEHRTYRNAA